MSQADTPAPDPGTDPDLTLERLRAELDAVEELPLAERAGRFEAINDALAAELGRLDGV